MTSENEYEWIWTEAELETEYINELQRHFISILACNLSETEKLISFNLQNLPFIYIRHHNVSVDIFEGLLTESLFKKQTNKQKEAQRIN